MNQVLDNPIWNGLQTTNKLLSQGDDEAKFLPLSISAHAGLRENSRLNLKHLYQLLPRRRIVTLFSDNPLPVEDEWIIQDKRSLLQLLYQGKEPIAASFPQVRPLNLSHVPAILALTKLTVPGPFQENTLAFGQYHGIFHQEELIAMAGYRFQPYPYVEISAVCTHPAHLGRGHAMTIIHSLMKDIFEDKRTPFLHVSPQNHKALRLYENLGFAYRRTLTLYTLQKK